MSGISVAVGRVLLLLLLAVLTLSLSFQPLQAQVVPLDQGQSIDEKRAGWLPYLFATDSLGTAVGAAAFSAGNLQPQSSIFGTAFVTSNDSYLLYGAVDNVRLGDSRFFIDSFLLANHFTDQRFYADYDRELDDIPAGSNDSDKNDFVRGISDELSFDRQIVPFFEAGRVGPEYDSDLFFEDLKWDAGVGIRLMAFRMPVRLDFAVSDEGSSVWAMFGQPFARQGR